MHLDRWKNRFLIRCVGKKTYKKEVDIARQHALLSNLRLEELLLRYSICGREKSLKEQDWKFISVIPFNLANCNNWFWKIYFKITLIGFKQLFRQFRYVSVFNRKPAIKLHLWFFFFVPTMNEIRTCGREKVEKVMMLKNDHRSSSSAILRVNLNVSAIWTILRENNWDVLSDFQTLWLLVSWYVLT